MGGGMEIREEQGEAVELRACARLHGVMVGPSLLEIRRGDLLVTYDLAESWRQQRSIYTVQVLPGHRGAPVSQSSN